jgi:type I restriction enzyme S subunit
VSSAWLFEVVSSQQFSEYLASQESGAAYPAVKPKDFERAPVVRPVTTIESMFAKRVSPVHSEVWALREQSKALAATRDLLLPRLVSGAIDVSSLDLDVELERASA